MYQMPKIIIANYSLLSSTHHVLHLAMNSDAEPTQIYNIDT